MNIVPLNFEKTTKDISFDSNEIDNLRKLLKFISYDETQKSLIIRNGKSRIVVREDGTIRVEGESVTNVAQGGIKLNAAFIELN